ncbi:MAG: acyltransferase [Spirochaetia bacterium]|jgi:hypothetical protein
MSTTLSLSAGPTAVPVPATAGRIEFLSRYKGFLAVLVVLMHVGITYGGPGSWMFHDGNGVPWLTFLITMTSALSQSFVLGAFFFISAYFLPRSLEKKGAGRFLLDRLVKLGIPYGLFSILVSPLLVMAVRAHAGKPVPFGPYFDSGPLWFIEALFIFTLVFMGVDAVRKALGKAPGLRSPPSTGAIFLYIVCAAALGFAVRIFFPIGRSLHNLQLGYFPMYVILFVTGIAAGRGNWLEMIPRVKLGPWAPLAAAAAVALPPILVFGGAAKDVGPFLGGLTWQNAVYAGWEALAGTALLITSFVLFARGRWNRSGTGASFGSSSFGIFVLQWPVIVLGGIALSFLPLYPALKWAILAAGGICLLWGLTALLKKVPGVSRVL